MKCIADIFIPVSNMINNFDLAAIIAAVISLAASIYVLRTTPKYDLVYQRYTSLIFPLFDLLEPYLFKPVSEEILLEAIRLIEAHKIIAGNNLLSTLYYCKKSHCQENYDLLCTQVSKEYDKCCSRLGLHRRSISYKLSRKQYKNKAMFILYLLWHTLILIVVWFSYLLVRFYISEIIGNITGIEVLPLSQ